MDLLIPIAVIFNLIKYLFILFGVFLITLAGSKAAFWYVYDIIHKEISMEMRFHKFKFQLGVGIVSGLECMVAGEIISTVLNQNLEHLLVILILLLIRGSINYMLKKDMTEVPPEARKIIENIK